MTAIVAQLLPDFISRDYTLEVALQPVVSVATGHAIELALCRSGTGASPEEPDKLRFGLESAASGFQVWLQLAVREAAARARVLAQVLFDGAIYAEQVGFYQTYGDGHADDILGDELGEIKATLERALSSLSNPSGVPPERITEGFEPVRQAENDSPEHENDSPEDEDESRGAKRAIKPAWLTVLRPRLYVLDEPEQRLHPALQRRAARWLVDRMREWRSQCILATHSTAFMDLPGDATVYELTRAGSMTAIRRLNMGEVTAHSEFAREMGLDRGELLSRWRGFLFVEGLADAAVLEELFRAARESTDPSHPRSRPPQPRRPARHDGVGGGRRDADHCAHRLAHGARNPGHARSDAPRACREDGAAGRDRHGGENRRTVTPA
jgi:hypothetical protein